MNAWFSLKPQSHLQPRTGARVLENQDCSWETLGQGSDVVTEGNKSLGS